MPKIKLDKSQVARVNIALRELHDATVAVPKLAACGHDCQQLMDEITDLTEKLTALKQQFANPSEG